jgi:hypothetical protein
LVHTSVGPSSLFWENQLVSVLTWCYENLISSLICFGLVRIDQGIKNNNFFKLSSGSQIGQFSHIQ